jgi:RimJ/RimL family protein N-acetyltransferase
LLHGKQLTFRNATEADAKFILSLRIGSMISRYLSTTADDVEAQKAWLRNYAEANDQAYFIIEIDCRPIGTVRLYDARGNSFCWGSWILAADAPKTAAIESALMVYAYAIDDLGFRSAHFDVRKGNESVWRFHERFGAVRTSESSDDYFYTLSLAEIQKSRKRYAKYLPTGVELVL